MEIEKDICNIYKYSLLQGCSFLFWFVYFFFKKALLHSQVRWILRDLFLLYLYWLYYSNIATGYKNNVTKSMICFYL